MATKINPLDFGKVTNVTIHTDKDYMGYSSRKEAGTMLSMEVTILIPLDGVETTEIVRDALMDSLNGK